MSSLPGGIEGELQKAAVKSFFSGDMLKKMLAGGFGGDKVNTILGLCIAFYLFLVSLQSMLFSFRYAIYSLLACGLVIVGEVGTFIPVQPINTIADFLKPATRGAIYLGSCLGGIACFINISWNPFLLAGHLGVGFLGYRWVQSAGDDLTAEKDPISADSLP